MVNVRRSTAPRGVATIARRRPVGSAPLAGCLSLGRGPPVGCLCLLTLLGTSARPLSCSAGGIGRHWGSLGAGRPRGADRRPALWRLKALAAPSERNLRVDRAPLSPGWVLLVGSLHWSARPHGRSGCCSRSRPVGPTATRPVAQLRVHRRSEDLAAAGCGARFDGRPLASLPLLAAELGCGPPSKPGAGRFAGVGRGRVRGWT